MFAWVFALSGIASAQGAADSGVDLNKGGLRTPGFVENKGQWDNRALFHAGQPGIDYWVTRDGIKVDLYNLEPISQSGGPTEPGEDTEIGQAMRQVLDEIDEITQATLRSISLDTLFKVIERRRT